VVSFQLSEGEKQENKENDHEKLPELVNLKQNPLQKVNFVRKSRSIAVVDHDFDFVDIKEEDSEAWMLSRNWVPRLQKNKSIERLNRFWSPDQRSFMDENFKLIGVDLKNKIIGSLSQHKDNRRSK